MDDAGRLLRNNLILIELDIYFDAVGKKEIPCSLEMMRRDVPSSRAA
jgi:hypothetical protein